MSAVRPSRARSMRRGVGYGCVPGPRCRPLRRIQHQHLRWTQQRGDAPALCHLRARAKSGRNTALLPPAETGVTTKRARPMPKHDASLRVYQSEKRSRLRCGRANRTRGLSVCQHLPSQPYITFPTLLDARAWQNAGSNRQLVEDRAVRALIAVATGGQCFERVFHRSHLAHAPVQVSHMRQRDAFHVGAGAAPVPPAVCDFSWKPAEPPITLREASPANPSSR